MRLWRVCPHAPAAAEGEPGHPLYLPKIQGAGRIDNPDLYRVFYVGDSAAGAVAERFGNLGVWTDAMFESGSATSGRRLSLIEYEAVQSLAVLDLDEPSALLKRGLRPSKVVTPDRAITQRWARAIHAERVWDGIRWWSYWDPRWSSFGLWTTSKLTVATVTPLSRDQAAVLEATARLARPWRRSRRS